MFLRGKENLTFSFKILFKKKFFLLVMMTKKADYKFARDVSAGNIKKHFSQWIVSSKVN